MTTHSGREPARPDAGCLAGLAIAVVAVFSIGYEALEGTVQFHWAIWAVGLLGAVLMLVGFVLATKEVPKR